MPDFNALLAAHYMADAQVKDLFRQVVQECIARGEKIDQLTKELAEAKKTEAK